jgi:hypothetical protein
MFLGGAEKIKANGPPRGSSDGPPPNKSWSRTTAKPNGSVGPWCAKVFVGWTVRPQGTDGPPI